uniref:TNFR-Cys domain-containing protein n=1 Tax=Sphaeramia orbicularis TaxID=375764 RepID=A0A673APR6_9TELE
MGKSCPAGLYWDTLVKSCVDCRMVCQHPHVVSRCISHCVSADCKALPGFYYDPLLKTCMSCAEVCGRPPEQCTGYCPKCFPCLPSAQPLPVTTKTLLVKASPQTPGPMGLVGLTVLDSALPLYLLLALCTVLLLSSLFLALGVFVRRTTSSKSSKAEPEVDTSNTEVVVQLGQGVNQPGRSTKGDSSRPPEHEPLDDSSPTETCVCVHCFPDLKALSQGHDPTLRTPLPINHQARTGNTLARTTSTNSQQLLCHYNQP